MVHLDELKPYVQNGSILAFRLANGFSAKKNGNEWAIDYPSQYGPGTQHTTDVDWMFRRAACIPGPLNVKVIVGQLMR